MDISDFGQVLVLSYQKSHTENIISLVKNRKNICYISLNKSKQKVKELFETYFIDHSSYHFIDGTNTKVSNNNSISIENNPEAILTNLERILKEKNINCVILDDISSLEKIKEYQIPKFIQDMSLLIKSNESVGFFIGVIENMKNETIHDVMMFVDRVIGDNT